jgi:hypothetical protein
VTTPPDDTTLEGVEQFAEESREFAEASLPLAAELATLKTVAAEVWKVRDELQRLANAATDDVRDFPARSGNGVYADAYSHAATLLGLALNAETDG